MTEATKIMKKQHGMMDAAKAMKYEGFLGHPLTQTEMRLIPYVHYCAVNQESIDRRRIKEDEKELLKDWTSRGWCVCYPFNVAVVPTLKFWRFMCDVLWDFYTNELQDREERDEGQ